MSDKPLNSIRRLTIAVGIFAVIIVIGMLTIGKTEFIYKMSKEELHSELLSAENSVSVEAAKDIVAKKDGAIKFIDLRDKYEFNLGHVEGALNIPIHDLLEKENRKVFEDESLTYILYGADALQATGPWMVLKQLGFSNFKFLEGGYSDYASGTLATVSDEAMYDYDTILMQAEKEIIELQKAKEAPAIPKPVAKKKVVKVIPKKVVEEEEEEEGC